MSNKLRILLTGLPGTPVFEIGERLSSFHNLDFITVERDPEGSETYFEDKIDATYLDVGDMTSGSDSEHMARDVRGREKERKMDSVHVPVIHLMDEDEIADVTQEEEGVCSTELPDERLVPWATHIILLDADTSEAVKWFSGRRKCYSCGAVYHVEDRPSKVSGICDRCGADLRKKPSDSPSVVREAYKSWRRMFSKIEEHSSDVNFFRVRVDKARDFEHILITVDRWVRDSMGLTSPTWSYKK